MPEIISGAAAAGDIVQVLPLVDRSDLGLGAPFRAADLPRLIWRIRSFGTTHVTMVGGLHASDSDRQAFKRFAGARGPSGDAALLKVAERVLGMTGAKVVGAETIVPGILAGVGLLAGSPLDPALVPLLKFAVDAAHDFGRQDIGQAVVVADRRIVATEDREGTDALLARVAEMGRAGGLTGHPMILAKAAKPQQSLLSDRPAVGPQTIRGAAAAGIAVIAVEAGAAILVDRAALEAVASELGVSLIGIVRDAG